MATKAEAVVGPVNSKIRRVVEPRRSIRAAIADTLGPACGVGAVAAGGAGAAAGGGVSAKLLPPSNARDAKKIAAARRQATRRR
ncbi:MAG TPA: hypothetical protein VMJ31_00780, partial [Methylocystis sp.]|nr:hypothetical protein [Methylocystis sp.]